LLCDLDDDIDKIKDKYVTELGYSLQQLRNDPALDDDARKIFEEYGEKVWPDEPDRSHATWLVDAELNNLDGQYPRNLFFSNREDHDL
jgi:hypothetical protein